MGDDVIHLPAHLVQAGPGDPIRFLAGQLLLPPGQVVHKAFPGIARVQAVVYLQGDLCHQLVRLALGSGIDSVIDCDLGSGGAVLIDPLRVCGLEPDAAQGVRTAQYITLPFCSSRNMHL